jgi:hypothetical protein
MEGPALSLHFQAFHDEYISLLMFVDVFLGVSSVTLHIVVHGVILFF